MPNAEASLPSARERKLSFATPAMESTIASRNWRSLSFCPRTNGSSFLGLWFFVARMLLEAFAEPNSFRAPLAFGVVPFFGAAGFFVVFAIDFFFAGRAVFGCDFFFTELFGFACALELFFFAEVAIF